MDTKKVCRVCGASMNDVLSLGDLVPIDFVAEGEPIRERAPLTLCECEREECGLVQLRHTEHRDTLFRNYWYLSGLNPSMVSSLRDVVRGVLEHVSLVAGDTVIDVGANDGTLLSLYSETKSLYKIGFDPASNLATQASKVCDLFVNDYFESADLDLPKAKVITSIAMFYDLDDPRQFVQRVKDVLHHDGLWVVQMTDLTRMLRANAFDNICHEHLCYYSLHNFKRMIEEYGLEIFDVEFNDVNGASVRAYIGFRGAHPVHPNVESALSDEAQYLSGDPIGDFADRVEAIRQAVLSFIHAERAQGKTFHALGASTKGNTLLQYFGLSEQEIVVAAEVNPSKYGMRMVGSNVPIVGHQESLDAAPDYYLVLPWHFLPFFLGKYADYLKRGGKLLAPLPNPSVYGSTDL